MKKQYWAVGIDFDYWVIAKAPDASDWGSIAGPFNTLAEAKAQCRYWISTDRALLKRQLDKINSLKVGDL